MKLTVRIVALAAMLAGLALAGRADPGRGASAPADSRPADNLEYWLGRATPATGPSADPSADATSQANRPQRADAVPGVIELTDGRQIPGRLFTTRDKNLEIYDETHKRWRRVPLLAVLGIEAVVVEAKMEPQWRWQQMGAPEKVYTGLEYPTVRLLWEVHLIDGTEVTGTIKGQPLWLQPAAGPPGERLGPFILHERLRGEVGQEQAELVHVRKVVVSRQMAASVLQATSGPAGDDGGKQPGQADN